MTTTFVQSTTIAIVANGFTFGVYNWSNAANWTTGVPGNGGAVTVNVIGGGNPSAYDDLTGLFLDTLTLSSGFVAVGGATDLSHGASLEVGQVNFGHTTDSIYSDTNLGSPSATLVIDGLGGSLGRIAATGANALTLVQSNSDPGEIYQVDGGGELVLKPTPLANAGTTQAGFYYQNSGSASGTFAFENPGTVIALPLASVAIGDSIALPGTAVSSVTYGGSSIKLVTNAGTTTFSNVSYLANEVFTGFLAAPDAISGLERITFTGYATTSFKQTATASIVSNGFTFGVYNWSNAANWTNGVPTNNSGVTFNIVGGGNPSGYDDLAALSLTQLDLISGFVAVGGATNLSQGASLEVGQVNFGTTTDSIYSDTNLGSPSATLVVDGLGGTLGRIAATGSNALTLVKAASDPGEIYQVDGGGELVLNPTPLANAGTTQAGFYYQNSGSPSGTFAFENPGTVIALPLASVAFGDSIALPGTAVSSVTYGGSSIKVVTNVGTTTFSNVSYVANEVFTGFTAAADPISGLERVTFSGFVPTNFQQTTTASIVSNGFTFGVYNWSDAANWTNGVPANGGGANVNIIGGGNPSGYDDIAILSLDTLSLSSGFVAVGGATNLSHGASLEIGTLNFGTSTAQIYSDTNLGSPSATLVVDGLGGTLGRIAATGSNALTLVQVASDPGEIYQVDGGGELVLNPTPLANAGTTQAGFYYQNSGSPSGTFAFRNPGGTIALPLASVAIGDSIALPGSLVSLVSYGTSSVTVVTNVGTTVFSNVSYSGTTPTNFIATADPISGLERITFSGAAATSFQQVNTGTVGGNSEFLWSDSGNWTNGVPADGASVTFNIAVGTTSSPSGYDDLNYRFLDLLNLQRGYVAVGGTLVANRLAFSEARNGGLIADTLLNGGTAQVTINALAGGAGGIIEARGSNAHVTVQAPIDVGETYIAADNGMVLLAATPKSTSSFLLNLGDSPSDIGTIAFQNPGTAVTALLGNVGIGDAIELPGSSVSSVTFGPGALIVSTDAITTTFSNVTYLAGSTPAGFIASQDASTGLEEITFTLCFCRGTLIRTPGGEVPVEQLAAGDQVVTWRGEVRPITWIGVGKVLATRGARSAATPVIVRKGALADNVPHVDLHVTKGHSLWFDDVLIPVEFLVNHRSILWDDRAKEVEIYHVELDSHDVLIANGAPAESYRDDGNRWLFRNANSGWDQPPKPPCAPVLTGGAVVDRVWRHLLDRAGVRPGLPLTDEPDLHLLADGVRIDPRNAGADRYEFALPVGLHEIRLISRAASPQELGLARDPRVLGVAVRRLTVMRAAHIWQVEASDPRLNDGYHQFEPGDGIRWTRGDAQVPASLFDAMTSPGTLVVQLGGSTRYLDSGEVGRVAA